MKNNNDTILVEIAAYCDKELLNTVKSAIIQADYPERVHFAICYQSNDLTDYEELKKLQNCKLIYVKEEDAKGSCYARYLCDQMIEDETYIYQIDSHMRFIKHWDSRLIDSLLAINDKYAVISYYPPNCTEEMMNLPLDDSTFSNPASGGIMYTNKFRNDSKTFVEPLCQTFDREDKIIYKRNVLISAGNFFGFAHTHKKVANDPEMYFYADEIAMSVRLFTHGYNIYSTNESYIYHQYERPNRQFPTVSNGISDEEIRFLNLIKIRDDNIDFKEFGLGNKRTLEEYTNFSGIDFKNKIIYMNIENGEIENPKYIGKVSYINQKQHEEEKCLEKNETIAVIVINKFNSYQKCIDSCLSSATNKDRIKFIIGTTKKQKLSKEEQLEMHIQKYIYMNNAHYSEIVNRLSKHVNSDYVTIVDSSVRFLDGWDKYMCDSIKQCGKKAALTSWVWKTDEETAITMTAYGNAVKEYNEFNNYLPSITYKENINSDQFPYLTGYISDGFLFCPSDILKKIPYDPNLSYEEQKYMYALRLWTHGINIYYPELSYFVRTEEEQTLNNNQSNWDIVCALSGIRNYYSSKLESNYKYDIGIDRPLFSWYQFLGIKYDNKKKKLIEKE